MLRTRFYWFQMEKEIEETLRECPQCARFLLVTRCYPLRPMGSSYPFKKVAVDTGHITTAGGGKEYFFVAVDMFTKWIEVSTSKTKTGVKLANFLEEQIIFRHSCTELILSDRGTPYASWKVKDLCARWNIKHVFAAP